MSSKNLNKEKIFNISKDSIIREKIKKIALQQIDKDLELNNSFLNIIIKDIYTKINLKSLEEFENYLIKYNLTLENVQKKVTIDALWNELIVKKYNSKVKIDTEKLKNNINSNKFLKKKNYLLLKSYLKLKIKKI